MGSTPTLRPSISVGQIVQLGPDAGPIETSSLGGHGSQGNSVPSDGQNGGTVGDKSGASGEGTQNLQTQETAPAGTRKPGAALSGTKLGTLPIIYPDRESWYSVAVIPKRSGGKRIIEAPIPELKRSQRALYETVLLPRCKVSKHAFGCLKGRNIQQAAAPHLGAKVVLKMDLADCFHTITESMVRGALTAQGLDNKAIDRVCTLCLNSRGVLPQGAPTSPSLANIVMLKMYSALNVLAQRMKLTFTGYLDDLVFSGEDAQKAMHPAKKIIEQYGFIVKPDKVTFMRRKREVLGVCVAPGSASTRLPNKIENKIRGLLHKFEKSPELRTSNPGLFNQLHGLISFGYMLKDRRCVEKYHPRVKALVCRQ